MRPAAGGAVVAQTAEMEKDDFSVMLSAADQPAQRLTTELAARADAVITMGCGDACPIYPGKRYEDWELDDPADQDLETVRRIRDEIDDRVQRLVGDLLE